MATKSETTETRWPVLITVIGLGGIYLALPDSLSVGPPWLLLVLIAASAVPAFVAHYTSRHRVDRIPPHVLLREMRGAQLKGARGSMSDLT